MSLSHSPKIVTSGLVLLLDAANQRSFNSSENLLTYTNSIGVSGQKYIVSATPIITLNAATAPDGTLTATKIDNNGNSTSNYLYAQGDVALSTSTTYTYSIFLKPSSSNLVYITLDEANFGGKRYQLYFNLGSETVTTQTIGTQSDGAILSSGVVKYPNQWYRVYITFTTGSTNVSGLVEMISRYSTSNVGYNYFWGRQLEKGAFMTDYTPVLTTGIVSRPTTWTDLSNSSNNATLSSVNYNNSLKSLSFSTSASLTLSGLNLSATNHTVMYFGRISGTSKRVLTGTNNNWLLGYWNSAGSQYYAEGWISPIGTPASDTLWTMWAGTGDISGDKWSLWKNSTKIITDNASGSQGPNGLSINSGMSQTQWGETSDCEVGLIIAYNRVLTDAEILQNYNALKSRYGL